MSDVHATIRCHHLVGRRDISFLSSKQSFFSPPVATANRDFEESCCDPGESADIHGNSKSDELIIFAAVHESFNDRKYIR